MEIRNLISFVHVAEQGSFTKAAKALGYAQSTVSFQVKQLENELDCLLFERINHTVTLTDKGRELLDYAQSIHRLTEEFKQSTKKTDTPAGFIHIITPDSVCEDMLLTNFIDFHRQYPDIQLKFTNGDTRQMFERLDRNEADVIMTLDSHIYQSDYIIAKEEPAAMHFVTRADSPFTGKRLSVKELKDEPFLLTEKGFGYRRLLDAELARLSVDITPRLEVGRTDIIARLLERSNGISYLPDFVTAEGVRAGRLTYLDVYDIRADIWKQLIYHKNKWISHHLRVFLEYVQRCEFKA